MNQLIRMEKMFFIGAVLFLPLCMISTNALAEKINKSSNYSLNIVKGLISLNAEDASLKRVLEEMGQKMAVDVVNNVPAEEKVTVKFDKLPLQEAIKRLSSNYVYLMDSEEDKGNITKIVVLPKGSEMDYSLTPQKRTVKIKSSQTKTEPYTKKVKPVHKPFNVKNFAKKDKPNSEPLQFTFDPSQYMQNKK